MASNIWHKIYAEIGLKALSSSPADTKILCLQRLVRLFAYGGTTLILALFLSTLGISDEKIGLFMTLTLLGDVLVSLVLTVIADGIGRRRMLGLGALLMTASGIVFATTTNYWVLVVASVLGVISPSGNEIGPFKAIEESTISQLVPSSDRSSILAWYILFGTMGAAGGTISCGWVVEKLQQNYSWSAVDSYRCVFWAYAALGLVKFVLSLILSSESESRPKAKPQPVQADQDETQPLLAQREDDSAKDQNDKGKDGSKTLWRSLLPNLSGHTTSLVLKLCFLFALDSVASGLATASWMTYFFNRKFSLAEGKLGSLFFFTNLLSSASNLIASSLARRIGLIKTMVFTHIPGSVALILIPIPSNLVIAMILLLFRSSTSSMDQAPRQAFLAAAVLPEERTAVMGIVNVVKTLSQSVGPVITGALAGVGKFWIAFVVAGCLKILYDVLMLGLFLGYRTIEERAEVQTTSGEQAAGEENPQRQQDAT